MAMKDGDESHGREKNVTLNKSKISLLNTCWDCLLGRFFGVQLPPHKVFGKVNRQDRPRGFCNESDWCLHCWRLRLLSPWIGESDGWQKIQVVDRCWIAQEPPPRMFRSKRSLKTGSAFQGRFLILLDSWCGAPRVHCGRSVRKSFEKRSSTVPFKCGMWLVPGSGHNVLAIRVCSSLTPSALSNSTLSLMCFSKASSTHPSLKGCKRFVGSIHTAWIQALRPRICFEICSSYPG